MKILVEVIKGAAIGISNVIPGLSGATIAVVLGVYERMIAFFDEIALHPLKAVKDFWTILLGMILGIVLSIFAIVYLIETFPILAIFFLSGLILGSIPKVLTKIEMKKIHWLDILVFVVFAGIMIILPLLNQVEVMVETLNIGLFFILVIMGILAAASMVIPGISGSMILWVFGYYLFVTVLVQDIISNLLSFDFKAFFQNVWMFIPFAIGILLGLVLVSKFIKYALKKREQTVYSAILSLLLLSPYVVIVTMLEEYTLTISNASIWMWIGGIVLGVFGIYIGYIFSKKEIQT